MDISPSSGNNAISDFAPDSLAYGKRCCERKHCGNIMLKVRGEKVRAILECGMNESGCGWLGDRARVCVAFPVGRVRGNFRRRVHVYRPSESPLFLFLSFAKALQCYRRTLRETESYLYGPFKKAGKIIPKSLLLSW